VTRDSNQGFVVLSVPFGASHIAAIKVHPVAAVKCMLIGNWNYALAQTQPRNLLSILLKEPAWLVAPTHAELHRRLHAQQPMTDGLQHSP
jgi:hypothetical protein